MTTRWRFPKRRVSTRWTLSILCVLAVLLTSALMIRPMLTSAGDNDSDAAADLRSIPAQRSILFIGDSYTAGPGSLPDFGYPCVAATELGYDCNVAAIPGSGYISGGEGQRLPYVVGAMEAKSTNYAERLPELRNKYRADVVVLDGGRNDIRFGPVYLRDMMVYTLNRVRETWPDAKVVVILPFLVNSPAPRIPQSDETYGEYLTAAIRADPNLSDVTIVNPDSLRWLRGQDRSKMLADDRIHPNLEAHRLLGEDLSRALAPVLVGGAQ